MNSINRPLSKEEVREFVEFLDVEMPKWDQEQAETYGNAFAESAGGRQFLYSITAFLLIEGPQSAIMSAYVTGFQHGRRCENRLMAKAMREESSK